MPIAKQHTFRGLDGGYWVLTQAEFDFVAYTAVLTYTMYKDKGSYDTDAINNAICQVIFDVGAGLFFWEMQDIEAEIATAPYNARGHQDDATLIGFFGGADVIGYQ